MNIVTVLFFLTVVISYSQNSRYSLNDLKGNPKEVYCEKKDSKYNHLTHRKYFSFDKKGNIEKRGEWLFDSISNKQKIKLTPSPKQAKFTKRKRLYHNDNLTGIIDVIDQKGPLNGLLYEQRVFLYDSENKLKKITTHQASIDTLDLGYEQFNAGEIVSREYIKYELKLLDVYFYNEKKQLVKVLDFGWINECRTYNYNKHNNIIEKRIYKIHDYCDQYHSDCDNSIPNCKEKGIHRFNNYRITEDVWFDKLNYEYKYDDFGNWIEKKVYNYDYEDNHLVETITRKIIYK